MCRAESPQERKSIFLPHQSDCRAGVHEERFPRASCTHGNLVSRRQALIKCRMANTKCQCQIERASLPSKERSSRREENLSSTAEQHGANELPTVARITEFARTHVRGYRVVVAEVVAVERAPSPSPPSHGGEGRGEEGLP